jgi:glyoxylase-like metal-dependent hydrolase (beta-lactamase superfamily II)
MFFKNARYWSNSGHWDWATKPNAREKASFLKENILPMQESGQLHFVDEVAEHGLPFEEIVIVNGHTDKQMLPLVNYKGRKLLFCGDLFPSTAHFPIAWVMGYDTRPLLSLDEKQLVLNRAVDENWVLVFEHDAVHEAATVTRNERGVCVLNQAFPFSELG